VLALSILRGDNYVSIVERGDGTKNLRNTVLHGLSLLVVKQCVTVMNLNVSAFPS